MIHSTYDVYVDVGRFHYIPPIQMVNNGNGHHHKIAFHLYAFGFAKYIPAEFEIEAHWRNLNGIFGEYQQIDGVNAYTINGNVVTVEIPHEVICSEAPVMFNIDVQTSDESKQICTPPVMLNIAQFIPPPYDRELACDPYVFAQVSEITESATNIKVVVCGINEAFARNLALEYVMRPVDDNTPVSMPIEIGSFDLVNGHVYTVEVPFTSDFEYHAVLTYTTPEGTEKTKESTLKFAVCSKCGGIHSWNKCC